LVLRSIKAVKWACYFAVSATAAAAVRDAIMHAKYQWSFMASRTTYLTNFLQSR
jgi:hypothetical protein